jgi:predicted nucleotide-binding protein
MYNLIVSHLSEDVFSATIEMPQGRFLEYTGELVRDQLEPLSTQAMDCLKSWPCLLMREGRAKEVVHVARISSIEVDGREIKLALSKVAARQRLVNDDLWKLRQELDIAEFEFSRNHWAVKDRDLFSILKGARRSFKASDISRFRAQPLPAPSRAELLRARDVMSSWTHTEIDDFLLEAGVSKLRAGRDITSRRDRVNAIIAFALANPRSITAENSLFTAHFVQSTSGSRVGAETFKQNSATALPVQASRRARQIRNSSNREPNRVFVVHGQNQLARTAVVTELGNLGLEAVVLHDQPNMGRHLLTKFIDEAELVTFAVVLMTDDDVGNVKGGVSAPRARQNVILELGYFLSHLGQSRVCALISPGLETPSDFDGIVYIKMDRDGNWKKELLRELRAAGMPVY